MYKIQTLNKIAQVGLNEFPLDRYEVNPDVKNPDAILVRSQELHHFPLPSTLKVIGRAGAGVNNIPINALTQRGIPVFNTPGANANAVCELVLAGILMASRNLCDAWNYVKGLNADDQEMHTRIESEKRKFVGREIYGKTIGIIGLGSIGVKVANAASHLGMRVQGYDPHIAVKNAWELSANVRKAHTIDDLLAESDFVSLHVPLMNETRHLINADRLNCLKPESVLVNFSREGIVDNEALLAALNEKKLAAYVNDFPAKILKDHPAVISLPHLGASTREAEENCALMIAKQVKNFLEFGSIGFSANFPMVEIAPNYHTVRLAIVNQNIPSMVAKLSAHLAAAEINIVSLINKSRDQIAYTLIDIESNIQDDLLTAMRKIEGIIQIRKMNPMHIK